VVDGLSDPHRGGEVHDVVVDRDQSCQERAIEGGALDGTHRPVVEIGTAQRAVGAGEALQGRDHVSVLGQGVADVSAEEAAAAGDEHPSPAVGIVRSCGMGPGRGHALVFLPTRNATTFP